MSGRKKILFISHWARIPGGAEFSLLDILHESVNTFDTYLLTAEDGFLVDEAKKLGVNVIVEECDSSILNLSRYKFGVQTVLGALTLVKYSLKCLMHIKKILPDCVYTNIPKSTIVVMFLKRIGLIKISSIYHIRDVFKKNSLPYMAYKFLYNSLESRVVVISEFVFKSIPLNMRSEASIIYNGVNIPEYSPEYRDKSVFNLLYLGRIVPWKGIDFLIDMFSVLNSKCPGKFTLSLVGGTDYWDENYRKELIKKIEYYELESNCILKDKVKNVYDVYSQHDIFLNVSEDEPFGRVVAEALSFGMPVVAYRSGAISEIVNDKCGVLIEDKSVDTFVKAVIEIASKSKLMTLGLEAQKVSALKFDRESQIHKIIKLIKLTQ